MSTQPRLPSAVPDQAPEFATVLAHAPVIPETFFDLYGEFWQRGIVDQRTKEICRMRNARVTDCGFCKRVRFGGARAAGLTEEEVATIEDGYAQRFGARETAALQLTDHIIGMPRDIPSEDLRRELQEHFSDPEIVEIALGVGLFMALAKVLITLGLEPQDMPVTVLPTPGS